MSNSESRHSQELGKGRTPKDLLEPKESALSGECVGIPKKPDTEELADKIHRQRHFRRTMID